MELLIANIVILLVITALPLVAAYFSWKNFWFLFSVNMSILILYAAVGGISGYMPFYRRFLFILFLWGAFFVTFNICAILQFWEDYGVLTLLLLFISIWGFWLPGLAGEVGKDIRMKVFKNRLYLYEAAVKELTPMIDANGLDLRGEQIPRKYRKLARRINAEKNEGVVFLFDLDPGFFQPSSLVFIYRSDDFLAKKGMDLKCEPPFCERINDNWFRVGD